MMLFAEAKSTAPWLLTWAKKDTQRGNLYVKSLEPVQRKTVPPSFWSKGPTL